MMKFRVYSYGYPEGPQHDTEQQAREWADKNKPHLRFATGYTGFSIREEEELPN